MLDMHAILSLFVCLHTVVESSSAYCIGVFSCTSSAQSQCYDIGQF